MVLQYTNHALEQREKIKREYGKLLLKGCYEEVEELERREGMKEVTLNSVISRLILNSDNGQRERLVNAFRHRGYGPGWLEIRSYDKDL